MVPPRGRGAKAGRDRFFFFDITSSGSLQRRPLEFFFFNFYYFLSHRYQCFKSAWMYQVLHEGFHFPYNYPNLQTAQLVYDREVQWTLGAILYKTRFLPLR